MSGIHMMAVALTYPQTVVDLAQEFFVLGNEVRPFLLPLMLKVKNDQALHTSASNKR